MRIQLNFDPADLARVNLLLNEIDAKRTMARAINSTLIPTRTDAIRAIAIDLNLTQRRIGQDFSIERASAEWLGAKVEAKGRPVNLASFIGTTENVSDYRGGITVRIKRSGSRQRFEHGFLWHRTTSSGDNAVTAFERDKPPYHTFRSRFSPWKRIFPERPAVSGKRRVRSMTGPRIEDEFSKDRVIIPVELDAGARLEQALDRELEEIMSRH